MSIAELTPLLLLSIVSEIEEHEGRRSRIKDVIRNLAIILSLIAPPLIILWKVALS